MGKNGLKIFVLVLLTTFGSVSESTAQTDREHVEVALRLVGHEILLRAKDSTSLVLPIESEKNKFRINFESRFPFSPSNLISLVDSIFAVAKIKDHYRLEVENIDEKEVVYSYEVVPNDEGLIPCASRHQPEANYSVLVAFLDDQGRPISFDDELAEQAIQKSSSTKGVVSVLVLMAIALAIGVYFWRIKNRSKTESGIIRIGKYQFDQRNMKLFFKKESIDLTSKESDLLSLLHSSMDETIEREKILKVVWGDEGDYVGRTLDVFISKLRKKFSEDDNVKIVNVRGVGYKLMLSQAK